MKIDKDIAELKRATVWNSV